MKRLLCLCFALVMSASAAPMKSHDLDYKRMLQAEYDAWDTMDPVKVAPFYAKDDDSIFFDIAPLKYKNWAEWEKGVKDVLSAYKSIRIVVNDDVHGGRNGDLAWAACTLDFTATGIDGHIEHMTLRESVVYQRRGNEWLIVHEHVSVPLPEPAPAPAKK